MKRAKRPGVRRASAALYASHDGTNDEAKAKQAIAGMRVGSWNAK
jgi:hypothetical protein